jgi:ribosome-associated protein
MNEEFQNQDQENLPPSKSELKRQMHELQNLGERLVELPEAQLSLFDLPDNLLDAIALARKITKHGGRRRQLQFIGKLMRNYDTSAIQQVFADIDAGHQQSVEQFHLAERWRDKLVNPNTSKQALTEWLNQYHDCDVQQLRHLQRDALQVKNQAKQKRAAKELFQLLSQQLDSAQNG